MSTMIRKLLIANRGEIAVRIARAAADLGIETVTVYSEDDAESAHVGYGNLAHPLQGRGAAAYLDVAQIVAAGVEHHCDAVHPGYGFLSENAGFARACTAAGLRFVGPSPEVLDLFGDKAQARELGRACGIPVLAGTEAATSLEEARRFLDSLGPNAAVMIKAVAGGGGRGMRLVEQAADLDQAYTRCQSEALRSFGNDAVYAERFVRRARHIEVQIVSDGAEMTHLWERECSLQRQNQKLVEIAPAFGLAPELRQRMLDAALRLARESGYANLGTFEFLLDLEHPGEFCFIEANPRIQVEHTVTEEVMGLDLIALQLRIASGQSLAEIGLAGEVAAPRGYSVQLRVNMEAMDAEGRVHPSAGTITAFAPPGGPGVRVDTFGYAGYETVTSFDSLLAKLIVTAPAGDLSAALAKAHRAAGEFRIEGIATNLPFLRALLDHPEVRAGQIDTRFVERHIADLVSAIPEPAVTDAASPLAPHEEGLLRIDAPLTGLVASLAVTHGDRVARGDELAVLEAMKMEHPLLAPASGIVRGVLLAAGMQVEAGQPFLLIEEDEHASEGPAATQELDLDHIRDDLAEVLATREATLDSHRPHAVEKRRSRGQRTARENIADLCDPGSFLEYGQLTVAYRHSRHKINELRETSPADGFVAGLGTVNAESFGARAASVAVGSYDATVFAGTQGHMNHKKTDRLLDIAGERGVPLVLFAEGGGGRPREDPVTIAALNSPTFLKLAQLSGKVPVVGVVSGRCFAGNAALLGLADVIIATEDSTIGMAGPALIEAAGLGTFTPEEVGPIGMQTASGVVDIAVADEAAAVAAAKRYLAYFQGPVQDWEEHDPRLLRHAVPENRLRAYDVRKAGQLIVDVGSWLELRAGFGQAYVTALARIGGRPVGVIANNPLFNAGAIDAPAADKAARFLRLCDAFGLPVLSLIDTPGIMVGPEAEATGLVRRSARLFAAAASLRVPMFAVVLRKAYGLGAMAAAGGNFQAPFFTVSWPTGELGGMGLEGGVRLGYKRELEAIADPAERQKLFEQRVAVRYAKGKASFIASYFELDAVIDPAETRTWLLRGLDATARAGNDWPGGFIDTW